MIVITVISLVMLDTTASTKITVKIIFLLNVVWAIIFTLFVKPDQRKLKFEKAMDKTDCFDLFMAPRTATILGLTSLIISLILVAMKTNNLFNPGLWIYPPYAGVLGLCIHIVKASFRMKGYTVKDILKVYKTTFAAKMAIQDILFALWDTRWWRY